MKKHVLPIILSLLILIISLSCEQPRNRRTLTRPIYDPIIIDDDDDGDDDDDPSPTPSGSATIPIETPPTPTEYDHCNFDNNPYNVNSNYLYNFGICQSKTSDTKFFITFPSTPPGICVFPNHAYPSGYQTNYELLASHIQCLDTQQMQAGQIMEFTLAKTKSKTINALLFTKDENYYYQERIWSPIVGWIGDASLYNPSVYIECFYLLQWNDDSYCRLFNNANQYTIVRFGSNGLPQN